MGRRDREPGPAGAPAVLPARRARRLARRRRGRARRSRGSARRREDPGPPRVGAPRPRVGVEGAELRGRSGASRDYRWAQLTVACPEPPRPRFVRGDSNSSGAVDISDGVHALEFLFRGGEAPLCADAADADDSGVLELTDPVFLFNHLFLGGPQPPAPGPSDCGADPTPLDGLLCVESPGCA